MEWGSMATKGWMPIYLLSVSLLIGHIAADDLLGGEGVDPHGHGVNLAPVHRVLDDLGGALMTRQHTRNRQHSNLSYSENRDTLCDQCLMTPTCMRLQGTF